MRVEISRDRELWRGTSSHEECEKADVRKGREGWRRMTAQGTSADVAGGIAQREAFGRRIGLVEGTDLPKYA